MSFILRVIVQFYSFSESAGKCVEILETEVICRSFMIWLFDFTGLASLQGTGADSNGLYLIRDSTSSDKDFVVSVTHDAKVFHFQIKEVFDGHYKLDEGPTTQGRFVVGF